VPVVGASTVNLERLALLSSSFVFRDVLLSMLSHAGDKVFLRETIRLMRVREI
jgi:hypothetical protein